MIVVGAQPPSWGCKGGRKVQRTPSSVEAEITSRSTLVPLCVLCCDAYSYFNTPRDSFHFFTYHFHVLVNVHPYAFTSYNPAIADKNAIRGE
jgi:hypothetical protein